MNRAVNENFQAMFIKIKNWEDGSVSVAPMVSRGQQHVSITLAVLQQNGRWDRRPSRRPCRAGNNQQRNPVPNKEEVRDQHLRLPLDLHTHTTEHTHTIHSPWTCEHSHYTLKKAYLGRASLILSSEARKMLLYLFQIEAGVLNTWFSMLFACAPVCIR